jgi:CHASE3 domain sensor protein
MIRMPGLRKAVLQIGVPALLAFIAWNAYLAVQHLKQVQTIAALALESSAIQAEQSAVLRDVTDMETSQRGFLLTGNPDYLQPYNDSKARIESDFGSLRAGLSNRTAHEQSLESQLESLFQSKQAEMEHSISLREQGYRRRSFKLVDTNEGKGYMDEIRGIVSSLSTAESGNFARLDRAKTAALKKIFKVTVITNFSLLVLAAGLFGLIRRHVRLVGEEAAMSRSELAVRDLQLEKLTSALSGRARSNLVAINENSRLLLEEYGDFLPRHGHEIAVQMTQAAEEMEQLRQDLVDSPSPNGNAHAA